MYADHILSTTVFCFTNATAGKRLYSSTTQYHSSGTEFPVKTSTKIALGVLLALSKSLYDGTFSFYNHCVIRDPEVGETFWLTIGRNYFNTAVSEIDLTSYHINNELKEPVNSQLHRYWIGPVFEYGVVPKMRLFELRAKATFTKKIGEDTEVVMNADLNDGRWEITNGKVCDKSKCTQLPLLKMEPIGMFPKNDA